MSKPKGLTFKATQGFLKEAICWPGVTGAEKNLSKIPGLTMTVLPGGHLVLLKAKKKMTLIPIANFINIPLDTMPEGIEDEE